MKVRKVNHDAWGMCVLKPRKNSHNSQQDKVRDLFLNEKGKELKRREKEA